jgi:hypothetical protein
VILMLWPVPGYQPADAHTLLRVAPCAAVVQGQVQKPLTMCMVRKGGRSAGSIDMHASANSRYAECDSSDFSRSKLSRVPAMPIACMTCSVQRRQWSGLSPTEPCSALWCGQRRQAPTCHEAVQAYDATPCAWMPHYRQDLSSPTIANHLRLRQPGPGAGPVVQLPQQHAKRPDIHCLHSGDKALIGVKGSAAPAVYCRLQTSGSKCPAPR